MQAQIQKWGNSLGLRIPKAFAVEAELREGTRVDLELDQGQIRIIPTPGGEASLEELLARVDEHNLHGEIESGTPVGREIW